VTTASIFSRRVITIDIGYALTMKSIHVALICLAIGCALPVSAEAPSCRPVPGASELLKSGNILLLGELHGTNESPAFLLNLACLATEAGMPLRVGLEMPPAGQERTNTFLGSTGDAKARAALLEGERWKAEYQWGQTSEAIYRLVEGVRVLRTAGHDVEIVLFDQPGDGGGQARDRRMASALAAAAVAAPEALMLVQTGNIHSRVTIGTPWVADYEPMGYLLKQKIEAERVISLNVAHSGGTAYACVGGGECGAQGFRGQGVDRAGITLIGSAEETGHDGWYQVGSITASLPARDTAAAEKDNPEILWEFDTGG
jgi:hypothetical protein